LLARVQEYQDRLSQFDQRSKVLDTLKNYLAEHHMTPLDVLWCYRQLKRKQARPKQTKPRGPTRSLRPTARGNSKPPANGSTNGGKLTLEGLPKTKTGLYYCSEGHPLRGDPKNIKFVSPDRKYVWSGSSRVPEWFTEYMAKGGRPQDLLLKGQKLGAKMAKKYADK
jgi:hypothetical protein